jgi:hypothetical protein
MPKILYELGPSFIKNWSIAYHPTGVCYTPKYMPSLWWGGDARLAQQHAPALKLCGPAMLLAA